MDSEGIQELHQSLATFAAERDWDQFHSPKNLSMALIVETAELLEHFQWLTEEESRNLPDSRHEAVRLELADIFIYLVRLADKLNIDLLDAAREKMSLNQLKYPADQVRGSARRASEYNAA
ncbi:dCTP diphosphatase [Gammaproteobacteria bacterium]